MTDDLDLRQLHGDHEPDPTFRRELRARIEGIVRADTADPHHDHDEGDLIMLTETRTPAEDASKPKRPRWLPAAAAAAAVAVIAGVAVLASGDDGETTVAGETGTTLPAPRPTTPAGPTRVDEVFGDALAPGTYWTDADGDPETPLRVEFDVAAEGWESWAGAAKILADTHILLTVETITNLNRDACTFQQPLDPPVGPTVDDLATALTQLRPFEVTSPPTDVTAFGYSGKRVALTIPSSVRSTGEGNDRHFPDCNRDALHGWIGNQMAGSFYGYNGEVGRTEEFWILDVEGTRLVIIKNVSPDATPEDVAELDAIFDSMRIVP